MRPHPVRWPKPGGLAEERQAGLTPWVNGLARLTQAAAAVYGLMASGLMPCLARKQWNPSVPGPHGCLCLASIGGDAEPGLHACCAGPSRAIQSGETPNGTMPVQRHRVALHRAGQRPLALRRAPPDAALEPHCRQRCALFKRAAFRWRCCCFCSAWAEPAPALWRDGWCWRWPCSQGVSRLVAAGLTLAGLSAGDRGLAALWRGFEARARAWGPQPAGGPCPGTPPCSWWRGVRSGDKFFGYPQPGSASAPVVQRTHLGSAWVVFLPVDWWWASLPFTPPAWSGPGPGA